MSESLKHKLSEMTELALSAEINLETLANQIPGLSNNAFYKIVKYQLACMTSNPESIEAGQVPVFKRRV